MLRLMLLASLLMAITFTGVEHANADVSCPDKNFDVSLGACEYWKGSSLPLSGARNSMRKCGWLVE